MYVVIHKPPKKDLEKMAEDRDGIDCTLICVADIMEWVSK